METTFHFLLYRAFHAQRSFLRPRLFALGLGSGQPKLLAYTAEHPGCRPKELAAYYEIDPAAVSRMLDALEKAGFMERRQDKESRRGARLYLTPAGEAACAGWEKACRETQDRMLRGFSEAEQAQFAALLERAYRNLHDGQEEAPWES